MSTKPTIVLVHGAFADAASWAPVTLALLNQGYTVHVPPVFNRSLIGDSAYIRSFVEQSRRRTGARTWHVYDDREHPGFLVEAFQVGTWQEHLSQHHSRTTGYDAEIVESARTLVASPPTVEHLVSVAVPHVHAPKNPTKEGTDHAH